MKYQFESPSDLAVDEDFIKWVKAPTPQSDLFWENWLQQNPFQREVLEEARQMVLLLSEDEDELYGYELDMMCQQLSQKIRKDGVKDAGESVKPAGSVRIARSFWQRKGMVAVAASVSVLLFLGAFFLYSSLRVNTMEYATAYGEKRPVQLPDGSEVMLNANSRISFPEEWAESEDRLVQLEGEAFFEVRHKENKQKFVVQTKNGVRVEVLGTAFDVSSRATRNRVVLASGKVRLHFGQGTGEKQLVMVPGELVELGGNSTNITRKNVRTELYTSWKDNRVMFDNTSLRDIATMLEDVYGYEVTLKGNGLADLKLTAQLDDRGIESILGTVSETLGVTITKHKQKITISTTNK